MEDNIINSEHGLGSNGQGSVIRKPGLAMVGMIYTMAVILLVFIGSRFQRNEFYSGVLITEFILIALPAVALLALYRYDVKKVLRLNKTSWVNLLLIGTAMVFAMPVVSVLNLINLALLKYVFGRIEIAPMPTATDMKSLIINLLVIAGSAGICEEILFRGTIQRGLERFGAVKAILITAFLFGLMHVDFQKLLGTFLLGALIGFFVYRTNSIYSGMFAHFTNNGLAVVLGYAATRMPKPSGIADNTINQGTGGLDLSPITSLPTPELIGSLIFLAVGLIFCVIILVLIINVLVKRTSGQSENVRDTNEKTKLAGLIAFIPGIAIVAFLYFAQGLSLAGAKIETIWDILHVMGLR